MLFKMVASHRGSLGSAKAELVRSGCINQCTYDYYRIRRRPHYDSRIFLDSLYRTLAFSYLSSNSLELFFFFVYHALIISHKSCIVLFIPKIRFAIFKYNDSFKEKK